MFLVASRFKPNHYLEKKLRVKILESPCTYFDPKEEQKEFAK